MENFSYISAFLLGLMGAVHCIGMCGGIVGALSMSGSADTYSIKLLKIEKCTSVTKKISSILYDACILKANMMKTEDK